MADIVVINKLSKRKRRCTLAAIGILSLFGGVEYGEPFNLFMYTTYAM